jgi:hypothetical protein
MSSNSTAPSPVAGPPEDHALTPFMISIYVVLAVGCTLMLINFVNRTCAQKLTWNGYGTKKDSESLDPTSSMNRPPWLVGWDGPTV